jgi:hypothetical protein
MIFFETMKIISQTKRCLCKEKSGKQLKSSRQAKHELGAVHEHKTHDYISIATHTKMQTHLGSNSSSSLSVLLGCCSYQPNTAANFHCRVLVAYCCSWPCPACLLFADGPSIDPPPILMYLVWTQCPLQRHRRIWQKLGAKHHNAGTHLVGISRVNGEQLEIAMVVNIS